jgi:site-specific DNA-methyltransferase (adenine-specific)
MLAYLAMMAPRLVELRRVLKESGSIYLHCDPTASHYLKLLMDSVFGANHFKNEIIWKRSHTKNDYIQGATNWPRVHDAIIYFGRSEPISTFVQPFAPLDESYIKSHYRMTDKDGRHYQLGDLTAPRDEGPSDI